MRFELVFLGSGTSAGVPMIACDCPVCTSDDPRDARSRASALVRYTDDQSNLRDLLIDTSPELRQQAIDQRLMRIDGVLYTHAHADHILGMDDLRRFNAAMDAPVDVYAEPRVIEQLSAMFRYIFEPHKNVQKSFVADLIAHRIHPGQTFSLFGADWTPLRLMHGRLPIVGFRVDAFGKSLAYCTDVSAIPSETYPLLDRLDVLVIDALRYRHHPTHMTVDQALEVIDRVRPRGAYLTHIAHDIAHAELEPRLPDGVSLAYDGLCVSLTGVEAVAPDPG